MRQRPKKRQRPKERNKVARYKLLLVNLVLFAALVTSQLGRQIEAAEVDQPDFLKGLSLPFLDWKTEDRPLTVAERDTLQPDSVLLRRYSSENGAVVDLAVIAGHRKRTVHAP